jgi:hypothetical protein
VAARGSTSDSLSSARQDLSPLLNNDYESKLWAWVRERQVSALHAWACVLGIELRLTAHASAADYLAATAPLSVQLVLGLDLDPASTDDLRQLVAQTLAPDGFIIGGIQQTESVAGNSTGANDTTPVTAQDPHKPLARHMHTHGHVHSGHHDGAMKGNAYNFATTPQHAASFDLVQGQLTEVPCFRVTHKGPLGCVESAYNWFASGCSLGSHLGSHGALATALLEFTSGWPLGSTLTERCAGQRHFLGFIEGFRTESESKQDGNVEAAPHDNRKNPYLQRGLMGFCMFHGCKEVSPLTQVDLGSSHSVHYVSSAGASNITLFG